jgi:hypothetical protein
MAKRRTCGRGVAGRLLVCLFVVCGALTLFLGSGMASSAGSLASAPLAVPSAPLVALDAVSCSSATACTAVGEMSPNAESNAVPVAERWNGTGWSIEPMPVPVHASLGVQPGSLTVSCPSSTVCFAVGVYTGRYQSQSFVERWDGRSWSIQRTPRVPGVPPGGVVLRDVSCSSAISCIAVGEVVLGREFFCSNDYGCPVRPLAERWNGRRWSFQQTVKRVHGIFAAVSCPSKRACFAIGTQQPREFPDPSQDTGGVEKGALAERWNGSGWSRERIPSRGYFAQPLIGYFTDLSCVSASSCLAVGAWDNNNDFCSNLALDARTSRVTSCGGGLVLGWNGSRWSLQVKGAISPSGPLSCATATWCVAYWRPGIRRWNGRRWKRQPTPSNSGEVKGVSCISRTACVAVGDKAAPGDPLATVPLAWIWNGTSWIDQSPPNPTTTPMIR